MKINAVTTVSAVNHFCVKSWVIRWVVVTHARPLPGVFFGVCEENVVPFDVSSAVELVRVVRLCYKLFTEYARTVIRPEWQ